MSVAGGALLVAGLFFMAVTAVGLLRLPDFFSRAHAVSKTETLGIGLVLLGLAIYEGSAVVSLKLVMGVLFVFLSNPVASHLLTRAAVRVGVMPWTRQEGAGTGVPGPE